MGRDALVERIRVALAGVAGLDVAMLFGSQARARAGTDSDVDVAVSGRVDVLALAAELSIVLGREVDVVRIEDAPIPLLDAIVRDGVPVYERTRGRAALLRSRLLAQLEIDRPWYERMQKAWLSRVATRGILG